VSNKLNIERLMDVWFDMAGVHTKTFR